MGVLQENSCSDAFALKPNMWNFRQIFSALNITRFPQNCILGRSDKHLRNILCDLDCNYSKVKPAQKLCFTCLLTALYFVINTCVSILTELFVEMFWFVSMFFISSAHWHVEMGPSRGRLCATPGTTPSACVWTVSLTPSECVAWIHVPVSAEKPPLIHSLPRLLILWESWKTWTEPDILHRKSTASRTDLTE